MPRILHATVQSVGEDGLKQMLGATPLDFGKFNPAPPVSSFSVSVSLSRALALCFSLALALALSLPPACPFAFRSSAYQRAQMEELLGDAGLQGLA